VGIAAGVDHTDDPCVDERLGAGRLLAVMAAGFEGDIGGGAARVIAPAGTVSKSVSLGVKASKALVVAHAQENAIAFEHTPDHRVGLDIASGPAGNATRKGEHGS